MDVSFTEARANFARMCNAASDDREVVFIRRRNAPDVALIDADELRSLLETDYLLRSPANRERLLAARDDVKRGEGAPVTLDELRRLVGLKD